MKSVLISIRPQWCEKITSGKKTIEVRKSAPKEVPFKAYIYATRPKRFYKCGAVSTSDELLWLANGKIEMGDGFKFWADGDEYQCLNGRVIGEFVCDRVERLEYQEKYLQGITSQTAIKYFSDKIKSTALSVDELMNYGKNKPLYGLHISDLKIYDKPKELSEFFKPCPTKEKGDCLSCDCLADNDYGGVCTNNLTRPPQSYMFVEELK